MNMDAWEKKLLAFYVAVFAFSIYTNRNIKQQNKAVEDLRQLNKDTWVI